MSRHNHPTEVWCFAWYHRHFTLFPFAFSKESIQNEHRACDRVFFFDQHTHTRTRERKEREKKNCTRSKEYKPFSLNFSSFKPFFLRFLCMCVFLQCPLLSSKRKYWTAAQQSLTCTTFFGKNGVQFCPRSSPVLIFFALLVNCRLLCP